MGQSELSLPAPNGHKDGKMDEKLIVTIILELWQAPDVPRSLTAVDVSDALQTGLNEAGYEVGPDNITVSIEPART